jgi:hypothetical protein
MPVKSAGMKMRKRLEQLNWPRSNSFDDKDHRVAEDSHAPTGLGDSRYSKRDRMSGNFL